MTGLRVVVAEDEELAREKLTRWVMAETDLELVAATRDGPSTLKALRTLRPDVVFLDVKMPGLSGLEALRRAPRPRWVVFTTAFEGYAVAAFELEAVDYLLKPFGPTRFQAALQRIRKQQAGLAAGAEPVRLLAVERGRVVTVPVAEVRRFEARDDYVAAWTGAERYLLSIRLGVLETRLDPRRFLRIHRSHLINLDFVRDWQRLPGGRCRVHLTDGAVVDSSRAGGRRLRELAVGRDS